MSSGPLTHVACVNQDPGIAPGRHKGAAVHLAAMRAAFRDLGCRVSIVDAPQAERVASALLDAHVAQPIDLVYERYGLNAHAAGEFARARAVAHVIEVNAPLEEEARRHRGREVLEAEAAGDRALFAGARLVVVVSSPLADWVVQRGAIAERVLVRPNAVDASLFRPASPEDRARSTLAPPGSFVLGFHGRLRPWHNFEMLVHATARLLAVSVPAHLACIGDGDFAASCRRHLPQGSWTHLPWLAHEEVARHVVRFDVLPLTHAPQEGFYFSPLKLIEAMACAVVPVVPDVGDLPRTVEHGVSGIVYRAGVLEDLVAVLGQLHARPRWRAELGMRGRARAEASSWTDVASDVLGAVRRPAERCRRPC